MQTYVSPFLDRKTKSRNRCCPDRSKKAAMPGQKDARRCRLDGHLYSPIRHKPDRVCGAAVKELTADQKTPGSTPGASFFGSRVSETLRVSSTQSETWLEH